MAAFSGILGAIGLGISAAGVALSYSAAQKQAKAQEKAYQLQADAEEQRRKQMNLEAMRKKREILRNSIAARSEALATTTAQGANGAGSSALPGAYGSIAGQANTQQLALKQNWQIGNTIFDINKQMYGQYAAAASAGSTAAMGSGLSSIGSILMKSNSTLGSFFGGFGSPSTAGA